MSGAIDSVLQLLELAGLACALGLAILAIGGLLVSVAQVTLRGRVFVVPFRGVDSQRVDITILFASRLADIEARWIALAHEIQELRTTFGTTSRDASHGEAAHDVAEHDRAGGTTAASVSTRGTAPISSGRDPSALLATRQQGAPFRDVAGGPRTTGDEVLADMLLVAEQNSLADIDFGTLTVSGVSFSLQAFAALFRRLPGVFARRVLHGAISAMGTGSSLTVALEQRPFPGRYGRYRVGCTVHVQEDDWIAGVDAAAYGIAKARLDEFRTSPGSARAEASSSQTVAAAEIEAMSWSACEAFLDGYAAQLRHYLSGRASHRDEALDAYATALQLQPAYSRAAYNRATLLYNLYVPEANEEAIKLFEQATSSNDTRVRALAFAGLAMAYGQAIQRFEKSGGDLVSKAVDASQDALSLAPNLEEARFAAGWACQVQKDWDRAVAQYDSVVDLGATSAPGRRITSFALNNAGWIWMTAFARRSHALEKAEAYLWAALQAYPNKVAYVNLAEIARRNQAYEVAVKLFDAALDLDPFYVNAWNERAMLEVELAALAVARRRWKQEARWMSDARLHHQRALHLAGDPEYRRRLVDAFEDAVRTHIGEPTPAGA